VPAASAPGSSVATADQIAAATLLPQTPASKLLRAFSFNPEFREQYPTAHEELIEEMIGEKVSVRMVARDATPLVFVVPDGFDSVDLLYGPVEVSPGCGCDADLDQIVTVGQAKLSANVDGIDGPLSPGQQIMVTVPWRAATFVELPAGRLRMQVLARFYRAEPPTLTPPL
jgi:hypothetical protein